MPGVVRGLAELVVKKMLLTAWPIVENWSWVEPLIVWKTLELTPPDVLPVVSAAAPVMSAAVPIPTPRACVAAPPTRPWMTSPSPRFTLLMPKSVRVDVRLTFVSEKMELMTLAFTVEMTKLGAFRVLTVRVDVNISFDTI